MMTLQPGDCYKLDDSPCDETGVPFAQAAPVGKSQKASRRAFLEAMRHVAASVTIVTTDGPAGRHGATVSAFASVSADPPTVLVCLRSSSRICAAVRRNRLFTVSVLPEHNQELARAFAGEFDASVADRFDGIDMQAFPSLAPGIHGASNFACVIAQLIVQHTHTIVIGQVAHVATERRAPLLYHDATYRRLGQAEDNSFV